MRTPTRILAVCALLTVAACGTPTQERGSSMSTGGNPIAQRAVEPGSAAPARVDMDFGGEYRFAAGVTISVSIPKSFRPSTTAYPQSDRAVAFEIGIRNDGTEPYRLSGLSVAASIAGVPAKQVVDATQGFNGIVDAGKDVLPARNTRVTLAFAVPPEPAELQLSLRPSASSPDVAMYCGSA